MSSSSFSSSSDEDHTLSAVLNQQCQTCFKNCTTQEAMKCGGCRSATYCSKECQKAHWKAHKPHCQQKTSLAANGEERRVSGSCTYAELQAFTSVHRAALCSAAMQALSLSRKDQRKRVKTETVLFVFDFNPDHASLQPAGKKFSLAQAAPITYDDLPYVFPTLPQLHQLSPDRTKFENEMYARGEKDGHQLLLVVVSGAIMNIVPFVTHDTYLDGMRTRLLWKEEFERVVRRGVSI